MRGRKGERYIYRERERERERAIVRIERGKGDIYI